MFGNYRFKSFLRSDHRPILLLDVSAGLSLGALPGLERFDRAVKPLLRLVSGLVSSPGQIGKLGPLTQEDAGLLVRMDWNNTLRGSDFILPTTSPQRIPVISAEDALDLGAEGMVTTFLLGYDEEVEAACMLSIVRAALRGKEMGLPLVVDVQTTGPRVSVPGKAIELGASYALEGGADVIVVPYPEPASLKTLAVCRGNKAKPTEMAI
jgi:DhnA family fructose-bisphosphate aldolase class Ia